jgi:hypothetical protein
LDRLDEDNSGERNWALPLRQLLRVVRIASDQVVVFVFIELVTTLRIIKWQRLLILQRREFAAPVCYDRGVTDPDLVELWVVFCAEAERENLIPMGEEKVGIGVALGVRAESVEKLGERVTATDFVIRHDDEDSTPKVRRKPAGPMSRV